METTVKKTEKKGIIYTVMALCLSFYLSAQQQDNAKNNSLKEIVQDNTPSFIIIGSVVALGVLAYVIYNMFLKKEEKQSDAHVHTMNRTHHRHHHHKIIKKSA